MIKRVPPAQPMIIPDYLDGTKYNKKFLFTFMALKISSFMTFDFKLELVKEGRKVSVLMLKKDQSFDDIKIKFLKLIKSLNSNQSLKRVIKTLSLEGVFEDVINKFYNDVLSRLLAYVYHRYLGNGSKNYIVTKTLSRSLKNTKLTLKIQHIPSDFVSYIEYKEKQTIYYKNQHLSVNGIFFNSFMEKNINELVVSIILFVEENYIIPSEDPTRISYTFFLDGKRNIEQIMNDAREEQSCYTESVVELLKLVLSTIVYVSHSCDELSEEVNDFQSKKHRALKHSNQYTPKSYILVGRNYQEPKRFSEANALVKGHWKWRFVGEGRQELKRIWWNSHTRNYENSSKKKNG